MRNIVLASKSPRRKELLKQIVEEFEIDVAVKPERKPFWVKKRYLYQVSFILTLFHKLILPHLHLVDNVVYKKVFFQ